MEKAQENSPQITVFSISSCPHCKKAKSLLSSLDYPYVDISLTSYPTKRSDMINLADRLTVPQIFIHNKHIGGAAELKELHDQGKLQSMIAEQSQQTSKLDPRLSIPNIPPVEPFNVEILNNPLDYEKMEINGKTYSHWDIRDMLIKEVDIQDRKYHLRTYKKCFVGKQFVDFLLKKYDLKSRADAVVIGQQMLAAGFFHHVVREHDFEDKELFYRLHGDEENQILNNYKTIPEGEKLKVAPFDLAEGIKKKFENIKNQFTDKEALVDYSAIPKHKDFNNFQESFSELQLVELENMSEDEKLAFVINVYNMCIKIAFAVVGVPKTGYQRYKFFDNYKINIGRQLYSFNELESGILRENKKSPGHFSKHFKDTDPRAKISLKKMDCRIHFALNCGAKSCPPVKKFTATAIREELRINSQAFCEDDANVKVDVQAKQLWLTRIFDWYGGDFGKNDKERVTQILDFLRGEKKEALQTLIDKGTVKIKLLPYDWSNDAK